MGKGPQHRLYCRKCRKAAPSWRKHLAGYRINATRLTRAGWPILKCEDCGHEWRSESRTARHMAVDLEFERDEGMTPKEYEKSELLKRDLDIIGAAQTVNNKSKVTHIIHDAGSFVICRDFADFSLGHGRAYVPGESSLGRLWRVIWNAKDYDYIDTDQKRYFFT